MKVLELKNTLLDDLRVCISYEPHKEHDLLCMMEQYLKSESKRKKLLPQIKNLLEDKPYQNPFAFSYPYCEKDITELEHILSCYISGMETCDEPTLFLQNVITQINELHDKCSGELIDEWRKPKLEKLLVFVAEKCYLSDAHSVLHQNMRW